jgi:hypothetical protein
LTSPPASSESLRLYKFRALTGDGLRFALDTFVYDRLYMSTCGTWNDPEDGSFTLAQSLNTAQHREAVRNLRGKVNSTRCGSFAQTPTNPLLWAHYAGGFAGIALEYDLPLDSPLLLVKPITYGEPPIVTPEICEAIISGSSHPWDHGILLTKRPIWTYEREYRAFWLADTPYLTPLKPNAMIVGAKNIPELLLIEQIAYKFQVRVKYLAWSPDGYEVVD